MAEIFTFPRTGRKQALDLRVTPRQVIDYDASKAAAEARQQKRLSKAVEVKLRPIFVKAARGHISRVVVVYQEGRDTEPVFVSTEEDHNEALRMALRAAWVLTSRTQSDE